MGKCHFNKCWLEQPEFSWLKAVPSNEFEAQCMLCKRTLNLGTLVWKLWCHTQLASKSLQRRHAITHFRTPLSPVQSPSSSSSAWAELCATSAVLQSSDIQTIFGSTLALKAEVLWILNTDAKHQLYRCFGATDVHCWINWVELLSSLSHAHTRTHTRTRTRTHTHTHTRVIIVN